MSEQANELAINKFYDDTNVVKFYFLYRLNLYQIVKFDQICVGINLFYPQFICVFARVKHNCLTYIPLNFGAGRERWLCDSSFVTLPLVCILPLVCSLQSAFHTDQIRKYAP